MKNEKIEKSKIIGIFIIISLLIFSGFLIYQQRNNRVYKELLLISAKEVDVSDISLEANNYYDEASLSYEKTDYKLVESNCRLARDKFSLHSQEIREIRESIKSNNELMSLREKMFDESIIIDNSLYEACEYFESASRYYDVYYNTDTSYNDPSYDMGTEMINSMNEKIRQHDSAVNRYNDLLAEYTIKLEKKIG